MLGGAARVGIGDGGSCTRQYQMLAKGCGVLCGEEAGTGELPQFSPGGGELLGLLGWREGNEDQEYCRMS